MHFDSVLGSHRRHDAFVPEGSLIYVPIAPVFDRQRIGAIDVPLYSLEHESRVKDKAVEVSTVRSVNFPRDVHVHYAILQERLNVQMLDASRMVRVAGRQPWKLIRYAFYIRAVDTSQFVQRTRYVHTRHVRARR